MAGNGASTSRSQPPLAGRSRERLLEAIKRGPLVCDAAMGTRLIARGLKTDQDDPALWNLTHPSDVFDLHHRDVGAGAEVVVSNTFGGNRSWLERFGQRAAVEPINRRAVELARRAVGSARFVLGSIGPSAAELPGSAAEQTAILVECDVDGVLLETFREEPLETVLAEVATATAGAVPILVSLWEWPENPERLAERLIERGAAVLGMNCRIGIDAAVAFAERMSQTNGYPLLVKPSVILGRACATPAAFASLVPRLYGTNVCFLGGCCGTTEAHVAALASALKAGCTP